MSDSDDNGSDKTMVIRPAFKRPDAPKAKLVCIDPTVLPNSPHVEVGLSGAELTFGRGEENAVVLNVAGISRNHAKIMPGEGAWGVEDSGSTNGVFVNKTKVVGQVWLKAGDIVSIGKVHYKYSLETEAPAAPPSSHEIDLGESEKNDDHAPERQSAGDGGQCSARRRQTSRDPKPPPAKPATKPATARAKPAAKCSAAASGSNATLIIVIVVGVLLVLGAAVFLL